MLKNYPKKLTKRDNTSKYPATVIPLRELIMRRNMDNHAYDAFGHKTSTIRDLYTLSCNK
ncbi:unnamed protein product [Brassica oleracea]